MAKKAKKEEQDTKAVPLHVLEKMEHSRPSFCKVSSVVISEQD